MDRRKLVVSPRARGDRQFILTSWVQQNQSTTYSKKLAGLLKKTLISILHFPESGQIMDDGVRSKLVERYRIVYLTLPNEIVVITIWDPRRGPLRLNL